MDLRIAGVRKESAALMCAPAGSNVRALGVGREVVHVAVAAGSENDRVRDMRGEFAGNQVACDDTARLTVDDDQVEHLRAWIHRDGCGVYLALQRLVRAEKKLLACLSACVEGAGNLRAAKRPIGQRAAVFAGEGNTLGNTLVDDADADLGQTVDVGFAGAEVAAL